MTDLILRTPCHICEGTGEDPACEWDVQPGETPCSPPHRCYHCSGEGGSETVLDPTTVLFTPGCCVDEDMAHQDVTVAGVLAALTGDVNG